MNIRQLKMSDEPFLWEALYCAIFVPPGVLAPDRSIVTVPELACYVQNWMQMDGDEGVIVEDGGTPIGAAWLRCWSSGQRGFGYVDAAIPELSIAVLEEYRNWGLGTGLLTQLIENARNRFDAISLSVSEANPACRLYERLGFEPVGEVENDSVRMVRRF